MILCHFRHCNKAKKKDKVISDVSEASLNKYSYGVLHLSRETIHTVRQAPLTKMHDEVFLSHSHLSVFLLSHNYPWHTAEPFKDQVLSSAPYLKTSQD